MGKIKRSQIATFLNISSSSSANYKLVGVGVTTYKIAMNPKKTTETYISDNSATTTVDSYEPSGAVTLQAVAGDPLYNYLDAMRRNPAVLDDAVTDLVDVYMYQSSSSGAYPADKHSVAVEINDFGGDGGMPAEISFTFNYNGAPTSGMYNPTSASFVAN
jgi:hypothetical protein